MKWKEEVSKAFTTTIAGATRTVTTPNPIFMRQADVKVFVNGAYAVQGKDYKEVSPYSVEFTEPLEPLDNVTFHYLKMW